MTRQILFQTINPEILYYIYCFTDRSGIEQQNMQAIRLEPLSYEDNATRCIALDGVSIAVFDLPGFYVWECYNLYLDKDIARECKKKKWEGARLSRIEDEYMLTLEDKDKNAQHFTVKCLPNASFPDIQAIINAVKTRKEVDKVYIRPAEINKFAFHPDDTLHLVFTGEKSPIYVRSSIYESFWGATMPVEVEEIYEEHEHVAETE